MEKRETSEYQVEFTLTSKSHFYEVLEYLYEHYSLERAEQLVDELERMPQSLNYHPHRGAKEMWLAGLKHEYRFLLFNRTKRTDIKIIYYIQENETKVYVTDFFPTETDVETMAARSS